MRNANQCDVCGLEYVNDHVSCFMKLMEKDPAKFAEILQNIVSTTSCRAGNNEERLMVFRSVVQDGKKLLRILRGQPEPKAETVSR